MKVSICVVTFRRSEGLERLLTSFKAIEIPNNVLVEFIIVDNDDKFSAKEIYDLSKLKNSFYYQESRKGIPFARNKALSKVSKDSNYILFVDDDEWVDRLWLSNYINTVLKTNADVITGPVIPVYGETIKDWIIKGAFFERERFPNNKRIFYARTSNVMIKREILENHKISFNEDMINTGGTDTLLFMQLIKLNHKIFWCDNAIVFEDVPDTRSNYLWLIKRSFRFGNTLSICDKKLNNFLIMRLSKSFYRIMIGVFVLPFVFLSKIEFLRACQNISKGVGMIAGLFDYRYNEYKTTHGK